MIRDHNLELPLQLERETTSALTFIGSLQYASYVNVLLHLRLQEVQEQMWKMRSRAVKSYAQGHIACKCIVREELPLDSRAPALRLCCAAKELQLRTWEWCDTASQKRGRLFEDLDIFFFYQPNKNIKKLEVHLSFLKY